MILARKAVLENFKIEKNRISIEEVPFVGKINLRGKSNDKDFLSNAGSVLEILLPLEPNTKIENNKFQVIWLSPNEWLINFFNNDIFNEKLNKLKNKLNPKKTSVTDISENKTIIRIRGDNVDELLRKFMVLDIQTVLEDNSKVAQTIFVKIPILIIRNFQKEQMLCYDIHVNRSHTNYLTKLLLDGCNQFIN